MSMVQTIVRAKTIVQPGGQVIVTDPSLHLGETVEVLILLPVKHDENYRPAIDIIRELEGHHLFQNADEVDRYLREERESWDF